MFDTVRHTQSNETPVRSRLLKRLLILCLLATAAVGLFISTSSSRAAMVSFTVDTTVDSVDAAPDGVCADALNRCSLRAAVMESNTSEGPDTITLPAGTYVLSLGSGDDDASDAADDDNGDLDVLGLFGGGFADNSLTINGAGAATTIIDGNGEDRIFDVDPPFGGSALNLTLSGMTLRNGRAVSPSGAGGGGGAIRFVGQSFFGGPDSTLTISDSRLTANTATGEDGGAIQSRGSLQLTNTEISGNSSTVGAGGVIHIGGDFSTLAITGGTISNNTGTGAGGAGGVYALGGVSANIQNTSFASNHGSAFGGGLTTSGVPSVTIGDSSFTGNTSTNGGGLYLDNSTTGTTTVSKTRFTGNTATNEGGAVDNRSGALNMSYSLIVGNTATANPASSGVRNINVVGSVTAENNWWGCNLGPNVSPCDRVTGSADFDPWLILRHQAVPNAVVAGGTTTLVADFLVNSAGQPILPTNLTVLNGRAIVFNNAALGTISNADTEIQNGTADATFTAGMTGGNGGADATVDSATVRANITIQAAPDITCPADITVDAPEGACAATVAFAATGTGFPSPTVTCMVGTTVITSPASFPVGSTTVTCTADNAVPPAASCSFTVNVNDVTAPTITLIGSDPMTVECHTSFTDPGATATDCGNSVPVSTSGTVDVNTPGSYIITYSATDSSNNTATRNRTVNVVDTTKPTISLIGSSPMTVECHTTFSDPGATASDSCDSSVAVVVSGTVDANTPGSYTITYNATDDSGNAATPVTRTVNVVDTTKPTIALNGANPMTVECHTSFSDPGATATDSCDSSVPVTASGTVNVNVVGTYTITYNASDDSGNAATPVTLTVNVVDTTKPVISLNGADPMTVECNTSFNDPGATASDSCDGTVAVSATNNVNVSAPGSYTVTYTATDASGNTATRNRTVNVVDTTAPTITLNGANPMTVECGSAFSDPGAVANDGCAGMFPATASGTVNTSQPGTYTITYNASDPSGNVAQSVTRTVIVADTGGPVITVNSPITLWPPNHDYQTINVSQMVQSVNDSCSGVISPSSVVITLATSDEPEDGAADGNTLNDIVIAPDCKSVQLRAERNSGGTGDGRVYEITLRATDANGNTSTATFKVFVPKNPNSTAVQGAPLYTVAGTCP